MCGHRPPARRVSWATFVREAMRAWIARKRRLTALDAAIATGASQLGAGLGEDGETVRDSVQARLRTKRKPRA